MKAALKNLWKYIVNNIMQILCAIVFATISIFKDSLYNVLKIEPTIIAIILFLLYVLFSLVKEHKKTSYTELHKIQNICLRSKKNITSISQYIIDKKEKDLSEHSEVHIITNDLEHWDLLDIGFTNIAENIYQHGVTYVYYLPNNAQKNHYVSLKRKIIEYLKGKYTLTSFVLENMVNSQLKAAIFNNENDLLYNFVSIIEPNGDTVKIVRGDWYLSDQKIDSEEDKENNHVLTVDIVDDNLEELIRVIKKLAKKGKITNSLIEKY